MPEFRMKEVALAIAATAATVALHCIAFITPPAALAGAGLKRLEFVNQSVHLPGQSAVTGMALRVHLAGGDLDPGFELVPAIEYWRDKDKAEELGVNELLQRDWKFGADARYRFGSDGGWTPYAGVGLGLHIENSRSDVAFPGQPRAVIEDSGRKLAPSILLGVDLPHAGPLRNSVELGYDFVSELKQFKVNFGIGWVFGGGGESSSEE